MLTTEERTKLEVPVEERKFGVSWWMVVLAGVVALALGVLLGVLVDSGSEDTSDLAGTATSGEPSADAVDIAKRWGKAWESGDSDAVLALYRPDVEERYVVDQTFRAVWPDVEAAIDQINSVNDFERFELVRLEEFPTCVVAEYEVEWVSEGGAPPDQSTIVVVFIGPQERTGDPDRSLILASDIYVTAWVNLFQVDYETDYTLGNGGWLVID